VGVGLEVRLLIKAYRLGAILDAAAAAATLDAFGDREDLIGSAARRREVEKKRDRRSRGSARGTRRGRRPGRQKPLARLAIIKSRPFGRRFVYGQ
jgi:hypothetical protein